MNFNGVDIRGSSFSYDKDLKIVDTFNLTFKDAIYDETTTFNGISFVEIFGNKSQKNSK